MSIIFIILQCIASLLLAIIIRYISRVCKIQLSIHNIPIIIFWIFGLSIIMWLSATHISLFLMAGFLMSILLWTSQDSSGLIFGDHVFRRICLSALGFIIWPQLLTVMIFYAFHHEKIDENSKLG